MFLFEIKPRLTELPPDHEEGAFRWATREDLDTLPMPGTDRDKFGRSSGNIVAAFSPPIVIAPRISPINGRCCNPP